MSWFSELSNHDVKVYSTWFICSVAAILSLLYVLIIVRNCTGIKNNKFVLPVTILFLVSTITFGATVITFNNFQSKVTTYQFQDAKTWALYFNIGTGIFISTLDLGHWTFFYRYLSCALTMPYSIRKEEVPRNLKIGIVVIDVIVILI